MIGTAMSRGHGTASRAAHSSSIAIDPYSIGHPASARVVTGRVKSLGETPDAREDADGVHDGIETEDTHRAGFRAQQSEHVLDERRFARAVRSHQPIHGTARQ